MNIEVINNIFSKQVFDIIENHNNSVYDGDSLKSSHDFWNQSIIEYSKKVLVYQLQENTYEYNLIKNEIIKYNINKSLKGILYYYWQPGSYIPWHNDGVSFTNALTIYLNKEWEYTHGGLFQYEIDKEIKTIVPEMNMGVLQHGKINHSTTITKQDTPIRKSIQIFFEDFKKKTLL